jgi:hypothetical protein
MHHFRSVNVFSAITSGVLMCFQQSQQGGGVESQGNTGRLTGTVPTNCKYKEFFIYLK